MIGFDVKKSFFDAQAVLARVPPARIKALSKAGAFIRQTARGSIRSGKKPSRPGSPPRNRTGILKRFLYFSYDSTTDSVVVGPAKTNQVFYDQAVRPVGGLVPPILEAGGRVTIREARNPWTKQWNRADLRYRKKGGQADWQQRLRTVTVAARPFMAPALNKNLSKLPALWRDTIQ